jgi:hypothetical protein
MSAIRVTDGKWTDGALEFAIWVMLFFVALLLLLTATS